MGFLDKIKNLVNVPEEDYDDYGPDAYDDREDPPRDRGRQEDYTYTPRESAPAYQTQPERKTGKVVNFNGNSQLQVVLVKPERYEDATSIADHLNAKRTVVLNLESASRDVTRRLVDFLSGVAYANNGQMKRVANSTFIVTPFNVDIMGDLVVDEFETNGTNYL